MLYFWVAFSYELFLQLLSGNTNNLILNVSMRDI